MSDILISTATIGDGSFEVLLFWGMLFFSAVINAYASYEIKSRLNYLGPIRVYPPIEFVRYGIKAIRSFKMLIALALWVLAPFLYIYSISGLSLSIAHPVFICVNFVCLFLFSYYLLEEKINKRKGLALFLAFVGLTLLVGG